jgi:hypothetical protein
MKKLKRFIKLFFLKRRKLSLDDAPQCVLDDLFSQRSDKKLDDKFLKRLSQFELFKFNCFHCKQIIKFLKSDMSNGNIILICTRCRSEHKIKITFKEPLKP